MAPYKDVKTSLNLKSRPISFRVPLALYHELKAYGQREERSIGWILAHAAREYLDRRAAEKKSQGIESGTF